MVSLRPSLSYRGDQRASLDNLLALDHREQLVLEGHVGLGLKANTSAEDVGESIALLRQSIHDRGARRR